MMFRLLKFTLRNARTYILRYTRTGETVKKKHVRIDIKEFKKHTNFKNAGLFYFSKLFDMFSHISR